eukprot:scaffold76054_cov77-Cyclotella_meneghiniana.AAC.4
MAASSAGGGGRTVADDGRSPGLTAAGYRTKDGGGARWARWATDVRRQSCTRRARRGGRALTTATRHATTARGRSTAWPG